MSLAPGAAALLRMLWMSVVSGCVKLRSNGRDQDKTEIAPETLSIAADPGEFADELSLRGSHVQTETSQSPFSSGAHVSKWDLFTGFILVGLFGVGGIAASSFYIVVERRKWLTQQEYSGVIALSQVVPGANLINMTTIISDRFQGITGCIVSLGGLMLMPTIILLALASIYDRYADLPDVKAATAAAAAGAVGLMFGVGYKLLQPVIHSPIAMGVALVTFASIGFFQTPLLGTVAVMAPLAILVTVWSARR